MKAAIRRVPGVIGIVEFFGLDVLVTNTELFRESLGIALVAFGNRGRIRSNSNRIIPELRDPEFAYKLYNLRARMAEAPGRPLVLIMGSSLSDTGLSPVAMMEAGGYSGSSC